LQNLEYRLFYRRHLPHFQPPGATCFLTFRLANSIPSKVLEQLLEEARRVETLLDLISDQEELIRRAGLAGRRMFDKWDEALHWNENRPLWLRDARIAGLLRDSLQYRNGRVYNLEAFCIMPNHVHLVYTPLPKGDGTYHAVSATLHSLKLYTARRANQLLERQGDFWQHENYDHVVRDEAECVRVINYVINNPVSAGLVDRAQDWEWTFSQYGLT
jgi:putative transposase